MTFDHREIRRIKHNTKAGLCLLLQHLCGSPISLECSDKTTPEGCNKCQKCMNWQVLSERLKLKPLVLEDINDILLLVDQLPVSEAFFRLVLSKGKAHISFAELKKGIIDFEGIGLLLFGNIRFAYRELRSLSEPELRKKLGDVGLAAAAILKRDFAPRRRALTLPSPIDSNLTWHLGYIASSKVARDIRMFAAMAVVLGQDTQESYLATTEPRERKNERKLLRRLIARLRTTNDWKKLYPGFGKIKTYMDSLQAAIDQSRRDGLRNTSHYLALDYMDVYVATSMRERWEFEDVHSIARRVFGHPRLSELKLRYFDPTQSFLDNRVDKGLVEALMLKRARCTIYMAQETDTFGKDSELATTLAQGKPVIVFVPKVNVRTYARAAEGRPLAYLQRRLPQLLAEDRIPSKHVSAVLRFLQATAGFDPYFRLIGQEEEVFLKNYNLRRDKVRMCKILAEVEKDLFDGRASSLQKSHPLAIQVNLESGVANGVLVVRTVRDCAELLRRLLTNSCKFSFSSERETGIHCLIEEISSSPYRVMTNNSTVSNSFWSRYLSVNFGNKH